MKSPWKYALYAVLLAVVVLAVGNSLSRTAGQMGASDAAKASCRDVNRWNSSRNGYADCLRDFDAKGAAPER